MRRALLIALLCAACSSGSREANLIEDFFAAARLQDTAALSSLSRVSFNPRVEGTIQQFRINRVDASSPTHETVVVDAQVRTPDGSMETRTFVFTLERPSDDGRWVIVSVRRAGL